MIMVSLKDIAARARVSIGTVDRVLHDRGRVSNKTKNRVKRIVQELGYRPNIHARNLSLDRKFTFGVLMPRLSQDSEYWRIPAKGIEKAIRELEIYKVGVQYYHYDRYSDQSFCRSFREALHDKPDGLLIAPVLSHAAETLIPSIPKGLPYVFFDSTIPGAGCLSFIGQDPYQSGLLAARLMSNAVRLKGAVAIVKVVPEDFHINERIRGFLSGFENRSQDTIRTYEVDSHRGDEAFLETAEQMMSDYKDLQGVFVSNAWTHSIARHIHSLSRGKCVAIVGYDLVARNHECLDRGLIDFLISQRPEMQGYEGIYCLYEHVILRETVQPQIMVPIDILTRDNVEYYQG